MNIEFIKHPTDMKGYNNEKEIKCEIELNEKGEIFFSTDSERATRAELTWDISQIRICSVLGDALERGYGDLCFSDDLSKKLIWYFIAICEDEKILGIGVKTGAGSICRWEISDSVLKLVLDIRSGCQGVRLNGRTLKAATVVSSEYSGDLFECSRDFCSKMCDNPLMPEKPVYGGNDWYCSYGDSSFKKIAEHTKKIVRCSEGLSNRPYMVIDDGWEICHNVGHDELSNYNGGPWKYANQHFGDMKKMADEITNLGAIPGIWFRPLLTMEKFPDEYRLREILCKTILDPSVPAVLDIIKSDIATIKSWGYKLIKHDFSTYDIMGKWGFMMDNEMSDTGFCFHDDTKTTAEIITNLYCAIREAAGDDCLVIGCNTIGHLAAGYVEIQRTGDDTSGNDWERTKKMGINTLAFRMIQNGTFFASDADCVGITNNVPWEKNKQWLDVLSKSGTPLFVSIAEDAYTPQIKEEIKKAFSRAAENSVTSVPVDIINTLCPKKWKSKFGTDEYDF